MHLLLEQPDRQVNIHCIEIDFIKNHTGKSPFFYFLPVNFAGSKNRRPAVAGEMGIT